MRRSTSALIVVLGGILAGCDDGTGEPGAGTSPVNGVRFRRTPPPWPTLEEDCARLCDKAAACGHTRDGTTCRDSCATRFRTFDPDAVILFTRCRVQAACSASETACIRALPPLAIHRVFARACREKRESCNGPEEETAAVCDVETNDIAAAFLLYTEGHMQGGLDCLQGPCPAGDCALPLPQFPLIR